MCELLIAARTDAGFPTDDGGTGAAWHWAQGHVVSVQPDGFSWGVLEDPRNFSAASDRKFALLRFPGISVARAQRYLAPHIDTETLDARGRPTFVRARLWQIQWSSLPAAAKTILRNTGVITIDSLANGGDFTWAQVQNFVRRLDTNTADTDPLT
jgi:hypothetical protein